MLRLPSPEELPVRDTHGMVIDATIAAALNASGDASGGASGVVSANRDAGPSESSVKSAGSPKPPKSPKSSVAASGTGEKRKRGRPRKNTGDEKS